ncbi:MAG: DUF6783 domain-containing protein [Eisenbergiella sp.]
MLSATCDVPLAESNFQTHSGIPQRTPV